MLRKQGKIILTLLLAGAVALAALTAGCGGSSATKGGKPKFVNGKLDKPFNLKVPTMSGFNEIYIGEKLGFYKEVGLNIDYTGSMTGSMLAQSVIKGDNHLFGTGHVLTIAKAREGGAKLKMVLQGSFDDPDPRKTHMTYLVKEDSPIKEAKDLIGKKVSIGYVGSCAELLFSEYLRQNGIKRDQVEWVVMADNQAENALRQGNIDVAGIHNVFTLSAMKRGGVRPLVNTWAIGTAAGNGPASSYSTRAFSEDFIKENPDIVKAYIAATVKTQHWINKNYDEAIQIAADYLKIDKDKAGGTRFPDDNAIDPVKVNFWIKMMEDNGFVKPQTVKIDEVCTNALNPYLSGEIKESG
ncbi:MAG: ABC transporter substrate-binding protein [Acidaminococcales bacterium]|jgi:ABC-type nitrate/sulfonate/bicarbonate transport system substrate-binding protein|nr:ABC transporter substrate-binding protein [Acidaminococcales bacterium]